MLAVYEHYNVTVYIWVSQFVYHWYHLLYVDLYTVYISYLVRCVEQRCDVFYYTLTSTRIQQGNTPQPCPTQRTR